MDQKTENQTMEAENPNAIFIIAVAIKPPARRIFGEVRDPRTPDRNLDIPYMIGKIEVKVPI
jgi:hypothetical protein